MASVIASWRTVGRLSSHIPARSQRKLRIHRGPHQVLGSAQQDLHRGPHTRSQAAWPVHRAKRILPLTLAAYSLCPERESYHPKRFASDRALAPLSSTSFHNGFFLASRVAWSTTETKFFRAVRVFTQFEPNSSKSSFAKPQSASWQETVLIHLILKSLPRTPATSFAPWPPIVFSSRLLKNRVADC